jgi:nucleotide-binding universal stress UspA family protein
MISTIAVGFDGSSTAAEAVKTAAEMAQALNAKLVLLSAFQGSANLHPPDGHSVELEWAHNSSALAREVVERVERELRERGIDCSTRVGEGNPGDVLVSLAEECDADVLVIGNKGLHRRILGSVPKTVVQDAGCSVFVVKTT